ncbi:unannotated protein [freshwater metagenome]|uniref:Unannotated protein n=1 Tax=freshwater metagenome TaxID=449393 RepID=A0A6J7VP42_9ZZZZ
MSADVTTSPTHSARSRIESTSASSAEDRRVSTPTCQILLSTGSEVVRNPKGSPKKSLSRNSWLLTFTFPLVVTLISINLAPIDWNGSIFVLPAATAKCWIIRVAPAESGTTGEISPCGVIRSAYAIFTSAPYSLSITTLK